MTTEINLDPDTTNADWTKAGPQGWDFPPYKSAEFLKAFPDLDAFRKAPAYRAAENAGLICDDEWLGDYCSPAKSTRDHHTIHIHIH